MAEEDPELKMVKSMLRSVLISSKGGVPAEILQRDYKGIVGEPIPYRKLGHPTFESFIMSVPDVVSIERKGNEIILKGMADKSTAHIQRLVSKQKGKKLKPVRRPRGGGAGAFFQQASSGRGRPHPRRGGQSHYGNTRSPPHRYGMPSFISPGTQGLTPIQVQIGNSTSGARTITVKPNSLLNRAMADVNKERFIDRPGGQREVPPRFRRQQQASSGRGGRSAYSTPTRRPAATTELATIDFPDSYVADLSQYLRENRIPIVFHTAQARAGYISSIQIKNNTYGSEDIFRTALEAEGAAARKAIQDLKIREPVGQSEWPEDIDWNASSDFGSSLNWADEACKEDTFESLPPEQMVAVKQRVKQIISSKKNGLWASVIPHDYKETFKEEPPADLLKMLKTWTDIAKVEMAANTEREIVYPVLIDENMMLTVPSEEQVNAEEMIVYTTYLYSPNFFYVQREDSSIDEISHILQTHCKSLPPVDAGSIKKGQFCAGLYSADGQWTRAEVKQVKSNGKVEVLFVDYGNMEDVRAEDIRWLSPDIAQYPCQGIVCSLYGVEPPEDQLDWSEKATQKFAQLVEDQALIGISQWVNDENKVDMELYLKTDTTQSIGDHLVKAGLARSTKREDVLNEADLHPVELQLPSDKEWDVHVTYISSSTESVMVRLVGEEYSDRLDAYQARLQEAFRSNWADTPITEGLTYVAMDDDLYHRVRVISQQGNKVQCYFLDHGDTDDLLLSQLHALDPHINKQLPYQAVEVSLYGLEEVCTNITALESLCDLALGRTCVAEAVDREGGVTAVVLYDTSGETDININETILKTIEAEGGGIDTPRTISPSPAASATATPTRVLSPVPTATPPGGSSSGIDKMAANSAVNQTLNSLTNSNINEAVNSKSLTNGVNGKSTNNPEQLSDLSNSLQNSCQLSTRTDNQVTTTTPSKTNAQSSVTGDSITRSPDMDQKNNNSGMVETRVSPSKPNIEIPRFQIPVGQYLDVHVNFVHDPSNFVCIPYEEMGKLNQMLLDMVKFYNIKDPPMTEPVEIGRLYAGHKEGIWSRVRVSAFVNTDLVSVYEVDIGEFSVMTLAELRPLADRFRRLPLMAFTATLGSIAPTSGDWFEAAKYKFIELARDRDLVGLLLDWNSNTGITSLRLIDTSNEDSDICIDEILIKMGFAMNVE